MDTITQLLDNIAHDEEVTFRRSILGIEIRRVRRKDLGVRLDSVRYVSSEQVRTASLDLIGQLLWETAQEVRS